MAWKAFSGQGGLETCVCVLALLRHAAGLILSPNGVLHRLLQASGSTTWESWSDQVLSATWHTPWLLRLLSGIRVFSRGGKTEQTKPHPFYPGSETRSHSQDPKGQVLGPRVIRVRTYWLSMGSVRMCVCSDGDHRGRSGHSRKRAAHTQ